MSTDPLGLDVEGAIARLAGSDLSEAQRHDLRIVVEHYRARVAELDALQPDPHDITVILGAFMEITYDQRWSSGKRQVTVAPIPPGSEGY